MRKGFTVLELLVASLLLGMIMVILTMIFNQSSIAWKTGVAGVRDMDKARKSVSDLGASADSAYLWDGVYYIHGVFNEKGQLWTDRNKYINNVFLQTVEGKSAETGSYNSELQNSERKTSTDTGTKSYGLVTPSSTEENQQKNVNYIVNVMSYGPDGKEDTRYDNVYSTSPSDDPSEW